MERLNKLKYSLLVVALLSMTFNSCIKDDIDDCPASVRVYFDYLPATYANIKEGINPDEVTRLTLYWFDAKTNLFLGVEVDEAPDLQDPEYHITTPKLPAGEYRFIAWGNLDGCCKSLPESPVVGTTTIDEFSAYLTTIEADSVKNTISPLFYGQSEIKEIKRGELSTIVRIPIIQDTYTFNLKVSGKINPNRNYKFVITDSNTSLAFDNSYTSPVLVHYVDECGIPVKGVLTGSLTTMRISKGRLPILKVIDLSKESEPIFQANIIDLILAIEDKYKVEIDFSRMYEFDIEIEIEGDSLTIKVNDWVLIISDEDLHG